MDESPKKNTGTGTLRVIDQLHKQIDDLKQELDSTKISHDDHKKKATVLAQKNDLFVDQLANAKHENDMVHALLKRKERRIVDLEDQYNELLLDAENVKLNYKNMKIRCEGLQELLALLTAEYERLKIAYDALLALQNEYKRHYQKEVSQLTLDFAKYRNEQSIKFAELQKDLLLNDKDLDTLLDLLTNKKRAMETLYVNKNKAVLELLLNLAKVAKLHGQELKLVLGECVDTLNELCSKNPDLAEKISQHEEIQVDLDLILAESTEQLANLLFDDEATLVQLPDPLEKVNGLSQQSQIQSHSSQQPTRRRKNKRNSMRVDSNGSNGGFPDFSHIQTPTDQPQLTVHKRTQSRNGAIKPVKEKGSSPPPPLTPSQQNSHNSRRTHSGNKQKRRSMYGGPSGYKGNRQSIHEAQMEHA